MKVFSLVTTLALLTSAMAWSQDTRGTISGRVLDPSGSVVPGANVIVSNAAMGTKAALTTNADGIYRAPLLSPGR